MTTFKKKLQIFESYLDESGLSKGIVQTAKKVFPKIPHDEELLMQMMSSSRTKAMHAGDWASIGKLEKKMKELIKKYGLRRSQYGF